MSKDFMRVLLVKMTSMGDIIHNLPVVSDIKRWNQAVEIDWVVEDTFQEIPAMHPGVSRIFTLGLRRFRSRWWQRAAREHLKQQVSILHAQPAYDCIIDTQGLIKSALVASLVKGPRCGFDRNSIRERYASELYQRKYSVSPHLHAVVRNRKLAALALGYSDHLAKNWYYQSASCHLPPYDSDLASYDLQSPFFVFVTGTSQARKYWPTQNWRALLDWCEANQRCVLLPWGSPAEQRFVQKLAQGRSYAKVLPRLSLQQCAQLISNACLVVSVDTGLLHLAAELMVPTLGLYVVTNPNLCGPYSLSLDANNAMLANIANFEAPTVARAIQHLEQSCLDQA